MRALPRRTLEPLLFLGKPKPLQALSSARVRLGCNAPQRQYVGGDSELAEWEFHRHRHLLFFFFFGGMTLGKFMALVRNTVFLTAPTSSSLNQ